MHKYDAVSESIGITTEFLGHAEERFTGINRVKKNTLNTCDVAEKSKLFRSRQCIAAAHIAVDYFNVTFTGEGEVDLIIGNCVLANVSNYLHKVIPIITDVDAHNSGVHTEHVCTQDQPGAGPS